MGIGMKSKRTLRVLSIHCFVLLLLSVLVSGALGTDQPVLMYLESRYYQRYKLIWLSAVKKQVIKFFICLQLAFVSKPTLFTISVQLLSTQTALHIR